MFRDKIRTSESPSHQQPPITGLSTNIMHCQVRIIFTPSTPNYRAWYQHLALSGQDHIHAINPQLQGLVPTSRIVRSGSYSRNQPPITYLVPTSCIVKSGCYSRHQPPITGLGANILHCQVRIIFTQSTPNYLLSTNILHCQVWILFTPSTPNYRAWYQHLALSGQDHIHAINPQLPT